MGRIQDQPQNQAEYELQSQEYQYEPTQDSTIALDHEQYQTEEFPQHPSDAVDGEPQAQQRFQPPPPLQQYGNQQPNPAYMPQLAQQVLRHQTPQMNAMNANQLVPSVPSPTQSQRPPAWQPAPQVHVFSHGSSQPHGFTAGYPAPPPVPPFPAASPYKPQHVAVNSEYWTSGLFDCMNDPTNALITALFPCVTFGQVAEIVDRGHTRCGTTGLLYGLIGVPCMYSCTYRTKMRNAYGLYESPAPDWIVHCLCECCALCQEYRELQARGFDPSIGWMRNQIKGQNIHMQRDAMVPPSGQTMMG